ncbi:hypothetical protein TRAPUB_3379 [Trametes pubescens]|uniref:Uncharacterized protein n=1 Tax=Trametes pubescens TaxID=154538 RepID=A0A1M2VDP0_TRAPU|nr:hypothetical protein TRAPUB_3379 [Trametes pubescens]
MMGSGGSGLTLSESTFSKEVQCARGPRRSRSRVHDAGRGGCGEVVDVRKRLDNPGLGNGEVGGEPSGLRGDDAWDVMLAVLGKIGSFRPVFVSAQSRHGSPAAGGANVGMADAQAVN